MGFFAVLAASLFAVFIFTVFGGYSLLLWCQQSLWMVVPPALVLAVLVWTFLKMDDKITALQSGWMTGSCTKNTKKHENNTARPSQKKPSAKDGAAFCKRLYTVGSAGGYRFSRIIHPEEGVPRSQMQIAVIFVHYRLGRYQPDAGALVLVERRMPCCFFSTPS